jgi:ABC-type transport system involved in multi-copper enzyme maturation permease subunit
LDQLSTRLESRLNCNKPEPQSSSNMDKRIRIGRALLTSILAVSTVASFILDWSPNHLLNPLWHPHARFHGALLLFMLAGVSATAIWLMWRKSSEPEIALRAAALISLSFWTPLFYITSILPGSTSWAGNPETDPRLTGALVTPNIAVAAGFILLTIIALSLTFKKKREPTASHLDAIF